MHFNFTRLPRSYARYLLLVLLIFTSSHIRQNDVKGRPRGRRLPLWARECLAGSAFDGGGEANGIKIGCLCSSHYANNEGTVELALGDTTTAGEYIMNAKAE